MNWLRSLRAVHVYALFAALVYAGFVWAGLTGHRWLGTDDENRENTTSRQGTRSTGGRASYYHK